MCYTKYKDGKYYKGCADEDMCAECKGSDDCKCCKGHKCNEEGVTEDGKLILGKHAYAMISDFLTVKKNKKKISFYFQNIDCVYMIELPYIGSSMRINI